MSNVVLSSRNLGAIQVKPTGPSTFVYPLVDCALLTLDLDELLLEDTVAGGLLELGTLEAALLELGADDLEEDDRARLLTTEDFELEDLELDTLLELDDEACVTLAIRIQFSVKPPLVALTPK